ncbi:phage head spike fiber domain-containing protein [Cereibacter changlensis]|uniref:phage head spike fiber domain-containing protein n=1 Tax=Cereibacter changlensis TaxID=402884 RepID=UPI004033C0C5
MRMLAGHGLLSRGMLLRGHALASSVSPLALFAGGVIGVWFDPSDRTTLFEDVTGTIPATQPGQPVGLMLDKSKGLVLGPELAGGPWINGGNAVISAGGYSLRVTAAANGAATAYQTVGPAGKTYRVSFTVSAETQTTGTPNYVLGGATVPLAVGSYSTIAYSASGTLTFALGGSALAGEYIQIDNISVRELPGYHATQPVAASRPTLARHPKGGRRNLLNVSENFADVVWGKTGVTWTSGQVDPFGGTSAFRVQGAGFVVVNSVVDNGQTKSIWVRSTSGSGNAGVLRHNSVGSVAITEEWLRVELPSNTAEIGGTNFYAVDLRAGATLTDVMIWGAQLEAGSVATPYQKVTSQYDVTEAGVPDCWGLYFDGVDDFMVTPAIDLTGTDKVGVFAGVRKLSDAALGTIAELSADATIGANTGAFYLLSGTALSGTVIGYTSIGRGTAAATASQVARALSPAPDTAVLSTTHDIAANLSKIRRNSADGIEASGNKGAGNFGAYPLYIGRRGGTTLPFLGNIYGLIVAGKLPSAAEITNTETFLNTKMGAY